MDKQIPSLSYSTQTKLLTTFVQLDQDGREAAFPLFFISKGKILFKKLPGSSNIELQPSLLLGDEG